MRFLQIFADKPAIIAEIKFASPSHPDLYPGTLNHLEIAEGYLSHGAKALSVLTETQCFKGNINFIQDIRQRFPDCQILLKDFVLTEQKVHEAKSKGADAILLMAQLLPFGKLKQLYHLARSLDLCPLIEVHTFSELQKVLSLNPPLLGINNRNLTTGKIDLSVSQKLISHIPLGTKSICESGIKDKHDFQKLSKAGFDGFLIGTAFMKNPIPSNTLKELLS